MRRSSGEKIGTIERLMIDKLSGNVAYAVLSFGGFLGIGQKHFPIPWVRLTYDRMLGAYHLDLSDADLRQAPSVAAGEEFDWAIAAGRLRFTIITACHPIGARTDLRLAQARLEASSDCELG